MSEERDKPNQWHPLFAGMLRPIVRDYFQVDINKPVGDKPRAADIVLVRRTNDLPLPFRGLLQHLNTWNIVEFKGRTVSARIRHIDSLVEVGLGIDRRLNEDRARLKQHLLAPSEVSFWYIVNHFGSRFLRQAKQRLGRIEEASPGVWRSQVLLRPIFLIDGRTVPVERESVPLHLAGEESPATDQALAHVIVDEAGFWELYAPLLQSLHPNVWKAAKNMARSKGKGILDLSPLIEEVGLEKYLEVVKIEDYIETVGPKNVVKELGIERILANLSVADRQKLKDRLK